MRLSGRYVALTGRKLNTAASAAVAQLGTIRFRYRSALFRRIGRDRPVLAEFAVIGTHQDDVLPSVEQGGRRPAPSMLQSPSVTNAQQVEDSTQRTALPPAC